MRSTILLTCLALLVAACGDSQAPTDVEGSSFNASWSHTFPPVFVEAGTERDFDCQAVTLDNDEPLYVSAVRQYNDGAWHHSNWFHVPEDEFGADGTFDCRDVEFDMVSAALRGGVVFAQSTQTFEETTRFPQGAAVVIPPRSKILGALHLVNFAAADIDTTLTLELETVPAETIETQLQPLSFLIYSLQIPPQMESRWEMSCDMSDIYSRLPADSRFGIYYVMGHYHSWGNYFNLSYVEEDGTERAIVEHENQAGESLGEIVDPPVFADGAPGLKVTCGYNNNTDGTLIWGNDGDKEMCMFLAYIGVPMRVVSWGAGEAVSKGMIDGRETFEAACEDLIGFEVSE